MGESTPITPNKKPKFRKNPNAAKNATPDPQIRPPFQENYVEESQDQEAKDDTQINLLETIEEDIVFLTQEDHELYMLQQLQLESSESFVFKKGYELAIYDVHKQYSLRSKKNNETPIKRSIQTQTKIIKEAPVKKVLQILPRGTPETSTPRIVDITSTETQTEPIIENNQDKRNQGKTVET